MRRRRALFCVLPCLLAVALSQRVQVDGSDAEVPDEGANRLQQAAAAPRRQLVNHIEQDLPDKADNAGVAPMLQHGDRESESLLRHTVKPAALPLPVPQVDQPVAGAAGQMQRPVASDNGAANAAPQSRQDAAADGQNAQPHPAGVPSQNAPPEPAATPLVHFVNMQQSAESTRSPPVAAPPPSGEAAAAVRQPAGQRAQVVGDIGAESRQPGAVGEGADPKATPAQEPVVGDSAQSDKHVQTVAAPPSSTLSSSNTSAGTSSSSSAPSSTEASAEAKADGVAPVDVEGDDDDDGYGGGGGKSEEKREGLQPATSGGYAPKAEERQQPALPLEPPVRRPAAAADPYTAVSGQSAGGHFMLYVIMVSSTVVVLYLGYHHRHKILALMVEGRSTRRHSGRRYRQVSQNEDGVK